MAGRGVGQPKLTPKSASSIFKDLGIAKHWRRLGIHLKVKDDVLDAKAGTAGSVEDSMQVTVELWLERDPTPSWRRLIVAVDGIMEHSTAIKLRKYAEPLEDPTLSLRNVLSVLNSMEGEQWSEVGEELGVPQSVLRRISKDCTSFEDKRQEMAHYWLTVVPLASWETLASALFCHMLETALVNVKPFLQDRKDISLTHANTCKALAKAKSKGLWYMLCFLGIPEAEQDRISEECDDNDQCLEPGLQYWLENHPAPSWEMIIEALYRIKQTAIMREVQEFVKNVRALAALEAETVVVTNRPAVPQPEPAPPQPSFLPAPEEIRPPPEARVELDALEFVKNVGQGGFGVVWRGRWETSNGKVVVAIKQVKSTDTDDKEVRILRELDHSNIIKYYGCVVDRGGHLCIVTEFAEGGSIQDYINSRPGEPDMARSVDWAKQIAEGMVYLHGRNIIHRDLKSNNILLTTNHVAKICDLGAARFFEHTALMTGIGTYEWMSPEILNGMPVSKKTDVYSYAILLWELVAFLPPFKGELRINIPIMVTEGKRPTIPEACLPHLVEIIVQCWDPDPMKRPSFTDIVRALDAKEGEDIKASSLELLHKVGSGAFGSVFKGVWTRRNGEKKVVAVKQIIGVEQREIRILSLLTHKNIITFYGSVVSKIHLLIVTEFAENGSVAGYIDKRRKKPELGKAYKWAKEVAQGVSYLHQKGIAHRDLKSNNVVLSSDWTAKICDLGAARMVAQTMKMTFVGTMGWMSPEMLREEPSSKKCDVYSYGILLWELVTFDLPYEGVPPLMLGPQVIKGKRPVIPDSCPSDWSELVQECWSSDRTERPPFEKILLRLKLLAH